MYAASRAMLVGENPYDHAALQRLWKAAGGERLFAGVVEQYPSFYPPTTYLLLLPFAALPALWACVAWIVVFLALLAGAIWELGRLAELSAPGRLLLAAAILAMGPLHSGMQGGNPAVPAIACLVIALGQLRRRRMWTAMILFGISTALKPQLAAPFLAWQFLHRPRMALTVSGVLLALSAAALWRVQTTAPQWRQNFAANYAVARADGGAFDFTTTNPIRDHLVNSQVPIYAVIGRVMLTQAIAALLAIGLAGVALVHWRDFRLAAPQQFADQLLIPSFIAAASLAPIYHRYYDAFVLCIPIAWAFRSARRGGILIRWLALPLLLPVAWASNLTKRGNLPAALIDSRIWQLFVIPFNGWLVLAWCFTLLALSLQRSSREI